MAHRRITRSCKSDVSHLLALLRATDEPEAPSALTTFVATTPLVWVPLNTTHAPTLARGTVELTVECWPCTRACARSEAERVLPLVPPWRSVGAEGTRLRIFEEPADVDDSHVFMVEATRVTDVLVRTPRDAWHWTVAVAAEPAHRATGTAWWVGAGMTAALDTCAHGVISVV